MTTDLSQQEADELIQLEKKRIDQTNWRYPQPGGKVSIPLVSLDGKEDFLLDILRGRVDIAKITHQNRCRKVVGLLRLDMGAAPHRNPDGTEIPAPHLHIYREGYGLTWAHPLPSGAFKNPSDPGQTLGDFMEYCRIVDPPTISLALMI